ncbi:MAG: hypothetical protein Q8M16_14695 [Pirellulaceae bacterium]|nr:hypothetical protein [Pirellulaceae bacterium]
MMFVIHALFVVILLVPSNVAWQTPSTQESADSSVAHQDETFTVSNGAEPIEVVVSTDPEKIAQQTQRWEQVRDSIESSVRLAVDGDPSEIRSFTHSFVRRFQPTALKQHLQAILIADNADQPRQLKAAEWLLQFNDPLAVTWIIEQIINETALEPRVALISMLAKYSVEAHHSKAVTETGLTIPRSEKLFPAVLQTVREVNLVPYQDKSQEQQIMIGAIAIITLLESEHRIKLAYDGRMFGKFDDHFWLLVDISGGEFNPHAFTVKGRGTPEEYSRLSFIYRDKLYSMPYSIHADPGARYLLPIFNAILEREGVASRFHMTTGYFSLRNMFTSGVFVYYTPPQLVTQLEDRFAEAKE